MRILTLTALLAVTVLLSACNTVEGAGQDIERGGEKLSSASRDARN